ncbi:MAG: hypothetical protein EON58_08160 [Alphaproteobacteria bacterium]|nr:MAG: hypothetical protein EON58_08160 [Alphaproteobacteria bacterium]
MTKDGLDERLIQLWRSTAAELEIRVIAPIELRNAGGEPFLCEALVCDFGSAQGAVVMSSRTERRIRHHVRSLNGSIWTSRSAPRESLTFNRNYMIAELVDWGWFGAEDLKPKWYSSKPPR